MEDLPLGRIAALVPELAVKDLPLGRTQMMMMMMMMMILGGVIDVSGKRLCCVFSILSLPTLNVLHHSNTRVLERCFSKLFFRASEEFPMVGHLLQ